MTNKADNPQTGQQKGIQKDVLQPGIYFLNPEEKRVDVISIGYNETTLMVETAAAAASTPASSSMESVNKAATDALGDRLGKTTGRGPGLRARQ